MKITRLPRPTWTVRTLTVTSTTVAESLQKRGPALEKFLRGLEADVHKVRDIFETCLEEGKVWHYTVVCE